MKKPNKKIKKPCLACLETIKPQIQPAIPKNLKDFAIAGAEPKGGAYSRRRVDGHSGKRLGKMRQTPLISALRSL